jgi:hypothetical protein
MLAACGGSGGGSSGAPTPPPTGGGGGGGGSGPTWTAGVYQAASVFKDRCQVVRTGVDIEGTPFPDIAGSTLQENFWLRSWTDETYLWNNEVVDQNPALFNNRLAYFAVLKTNATTPSGKDKDEFHFSQPTDEYLEQRNSAPVSGYGASFVLFSAVPPRDIRVQYTEPGSPAAQEIMGLANFVRGAKILEIDGVDAVNANSQAAVDALNNGLFPATAGEMHTFRVEDPGQAPRTIMITSADVAPAAVNRTAVIDTPTGKVGYILLNTFNTFASEQELANAIAAMKAAGVSDLVLDLRYNGGGFLAVAAQLGFMVAGDGPTAGQTFEALRFNADAGNFDPVNGGINDPIPFIDTGVGFSLPNGTPLQSLDLNRVFILSTGETCSASEAVINGLRGVDVEVILIGSRTCGKPFGFYPEDNCGETYFTVQFQGVNDKGFGDYADGFIANNSTAAFGVRLPGCAFADDYENELGDETEGLLAAALQYRAAGTCPSPAVAVSGITASAAKDEPTPLGQSPGMYVMRHNRDMRMPE